MNCSRRIAVAEVATGRTSYRCGLDREMKVNRRMHCEAWSARTAFAAATGSMTTVKRK